MGCVATTPRASPSVTNGGRTAGPVHGHPVVDWGVWGRHVIHLICLRCNRANGSEAKFCGECGAGLLRKFCGRCRAINDAESLFCQSCGEALPAQPSVHPAAPMVPPASVPDLTDVYAGPDESPEVEASVTSDRWSGESTSGGLVLYQRAFQRATRGGQTDASHGAVRVRWWRRGSVGGGTVVARRPPWLAIHRCACFGRASHRRAGARGADCGPPDTCAAHSFARA